MSKITVLGLGAMGSRMAINFGQAGHDVTVWNRSPERATELASKHQFGFEPTPRQAAADADFVVSMVANDEAARSVWLDADNGAFAAMGDEAIAIESSTLTPGTVRELAGRADSLELGFVEAPVVGSRPQAEAGALFTLIGGDDSTVALAAPLLDVNSGATKHVGAVGEAALMKLAINGLFAAQVAAYAEVVGFLEQSQLSTRDAIETLAALPITSPGLQRILGLIAERNFEPNFPVHLVAKDLAYLSAAAVDFGAEVPIINAASGVFEAGAGAAE